jgi:hypothetical protein
MTHKNTSFLTKKYTNKKVELTPSLYLSWMQIGRYVLVVNHKEYDRNSYTFWGVNSGEEIPETAIGKIFKIAQVEFRNNKGLCWPRSGHNYGVYESECIPATKIVMRFYGFSEKLYGKI